MNRLLSRLGALCLFLAGGFCGSAWGQNGHVDSVTFDPPFASWLDRVTVRISGQYCVATGLSEPRIDFADPDAIEIAIENECNRVLAPLPPLNDFSFETTLPRLVPGDYELRILDGVDGAEVFSQEISVYDQGAIGVTVPTPAVSDQEIVARVLSKSCFSEDQQKELPGNRIVVLARECLTAGIVPIVEPLDVPVSLGSLPAGEYELFVLYESFVKFLARASFKVYDASGCVPSGLRLCLYGGRFAAEVDWHAWGTRSGVGMAIPNPQGDAAGSFYSMSPNHPDVALDILDRCTQTGTFWVLGSWHTPLGLELRVTDTTTGITRTYDKPLAVNLPSITDKEAFACE